MPQAATAWEGAGAAAVDTSKIGERAATKLNSAPTMSL